MKFIIGKKLNMTQVFKEDGVVVPVTRVQAGPCVVTQVKTKEKEGVDAVQVGFGTQKTFRLTNPLKGHLKDIKMEDNANLTARHLHDFRSDNELKRGDVFGVDIFEVGEKVEVTGTSKGKGFQGVVKRHGFHGSPASHGHKDQLRMPGSIGATDAARVFKGTRMGGHTGDEQVTVKNLEVVEIDEKNNEILIKGALPGARNGLVYICTGEGKIEIKVEEPKVEEKVETPVEEVVEESQAKEVEVKKEKKVEEKPDEEPKAEEKKEEAPVEEPKEEIKEETK